MNRWGGHLIWAVILVGMSMTPLFHIQGAQDAFRGPKETLILAQAMVIGAIVLGWPWRIVRPLRVPRILFIVAAAVIWTAVASVASTHQELSAASFFRVAALALIFAATHWLAGQRSLFAIVALVLPGVISTFDYVISSWRHGTLFSIATRITDRPPAFLGNANDIGAFLLAPALACAAAAGLSMRKRLERMVWALCSAVLCAGLLATQTLTPLAALGVGLATLAVVRWRRRAVAILLILALLVGVLIASYEPLYTRLRLAVGAVKSGSIDSALSGRVLPFYVAAQMFRDHPLTGVGPGCFGLRYSETKLRVVQARPSLLSSTAYGLNFGEAHNDHLQMLAVAGLPAYALMLLALFMLGRISFLRDDGTTGDERRAFAQLLALPLVTSFLVLTGAGFPLEIAATTLSILFLAALLTRWAE